MFLLLAAYGPGLVNGFFIIDDPSLVLIPQIRAHFSWQLVKTWFGPGNHVDYYPFRDFTYWIDMHCFHGDRLGVDGSIYRLQNWFWFYLSALAFFWLLRELALSWRSALALAALWSLHPIHSELLMWISARKDCLSLFFGLITAIAYIKHQRSEKSSIWGSIALLSFGLSLLSKASLSALPLVVPSGAILLSDRAAFRRKNVLVWAPAAGIGLLMSAFQSFYYSRVTDMRYFYSWTYRIIASMSALGRMLVGWIIPQFNGVDVENWGDWAIRNQNFEWIGIIALLVVALGLFQAWRRKDPLWIYCLLGFLATYIPISGLLFPHRNFYSVRYIEIPALILLIPLASKSLCLLRRRPHLARTGFSALMILLVFGTFREAKAWDTSWGPFEKALQFSPNNPSLLRMEYETLLNLKRWGHESPDEIALQIRDENELEKICGAEPVGVGVLRNGHLCLGAWVRETLEKPTLHLPSDVSKWAEKSLEQVNPASLMRLERRLFVRRALLSGRSDAELFRGSSLYRRTWLPTPESRLNRWLLDCLSGSAFSAQAEIESWERKELLADIDLSIYLADTFHKYPSFRSRLLKCKFQRSSR